MVLHNRQDVAILCALYSYYEQQANRTLLYLEISASFVRLCTAERLCTKKKCESATCSKTSPARLSTEKMRIVRLALTLGVTC